MSFVPLFATSLLMQTAQHVATTPVDRLGEAWWKDRHERCVEMTRQGGIDVVFLGDSITQGWEGAGKQAWDEHFAPLNAGNFGFSGDRTEHVLWRLEHGEIMGLDPKLIVIMIGTNNIGHGSSNPQQTADGVGAIVTKLRAGLPNADILLLGVFPRGEAPDDVMRQRVGEATALFSPLGDKKGVHFLDISYAYLRPSSTLRVTMMPDRLHLNEAGYAVWAEAIVPEMRRILEKK